MSSCHRPSPLFTPIQTGYVHKVEEEKGNGGGDRGGGDGPWIDTGVENFGPLCPSVRCMPPKGKKGKKGAPVEAVPFYRVRYACRRRGALLSPSHLSVCVSVCVE